MMDIFEMELGLTEEELKELLELELIDEEELAFYHEEIMFGEPIPQKYVDLANKLFKEENDWENGVN